MKKAQKKELDTILETLSTVHDLIKEYQNEYGDSALTLQSSMLISDGVGYTVKSANIGEIGNLLVANEYNKAKFVASFAEPTNPLESIINSLGHDCENDECPIHGSKK